MKYKILKPQRFGQVEVLTISRPEAMNALNSDFFSEFIDYLDYVVTDEPFRVLIITGEGKAFVAGADITEMVNLDPDGARRFSEMGQQTVQMI
jgi:enoyl-CoA hydratase